MSVPVLFTIPNFITAGSGQAMLNIVERLDRKRFRPAVCVSRKGGTLDQKVREMDIPFLEAPFTVPGLPYASLPFRARQAAKTFRAFEFTLWHSFHYLDDYTEPLIAHLSGAKAWVYTKKNMNWGTRGWWVRSFLAKRIAVQNTDMLHRFFSGPILKRKARLVQTSVDVNRFCPGREASLQIRARYGISTGRVVAAVVAHLVPIKGHPTLLEAVARVEGLRLLIAGNALDGEYTTSLHRQVNELGITDRVHFMGGVVDIPALLGEVDIFVLPTWARGEGCPVALLEAMACGKACIGTDVPGVRDVLVHGESGFLVQPADSNAMQTALRTISSNQELRSDMGRAARLRMEKHFTIDKEVTRYEELYAELVGV